MRFSVSLGLLLLLPAVALGSRISGTVQDLKGEPLGGAALEVIRTPGGKAVARQQAGADGEYAFELPPGHYFLVVKSPSLCDFGTHEFVLKKDMDAAPGVRLPRCVRVTGRAFGVDGAPLARGTVTLRWPPDRWRERATLTAVTDAEGRFEFPRAAQGPVEVGLQDASGQVLPVRPRLSAPRELELRAERPLHVLVKGPEGAPLASASVVLVPEPLNGVNLSQETDAQGLARFAVPAHKRYRLLAFWQEEDRFTRYVWRDVELAPGTGEPRVELRFPPLPPGMLTGRVLDAEGHPAGGAKVAARQRFPSVPLDGDFLRNTAYPRESATTQADAEGRFTLRNLREGEYVLSLEHERGYGEAVVSTGPEATDVKLWSSRCAKTASGRVIDERGAPVRDFEIGPDRFKDAQGRFTVQGACVIAIRARGFLPHYVPLPRPVPEHVTLPDTVLQRGRRLAGRVVGPDGKPVAGAVLTLKGSPADEAPTARADRNGRFSLEETPADGELSLEVKAGDTLLKQRLRAGEKEVQVRFPPDRARVDVRVLTAAGYALGGVTVTAEGPWGSLHQPTDDRGRAVLSVPPGEVSVHVSYEATRREALPLRFPLLSAPVPEQGTIPLELRAMRGPGNLRVLLPRPTHYDQVYLLPGVHPWPTDAGSLLRTFARSLDADGKVDIWAQPGLALIYYEVQNDFSHLTPGPYTVFTTNSYADAEGVTLFRKVVEVTGQGRQVVQVRFEGEDTRVLRL